MRSTTLKDLPPGPFRDAAEKAAKAGSPATYEVTFRVNGEPKGQPRPRRSRQGGVYNPNTADDWKRAVSDAAEPLLPLSPLVGPVRVDLDILLPRPQRLCRKNDPPGELLATCKPDRDNSDKAILDALTNAGMWKDDAQVCDGRIRKLYHAIGDQPGARITVALLSP